MDSRTLASIIQKDYRQLQSWRLVGQKWNINKGTAYRIAHGYDPKSPLLRLRLGLPLPSVRIIPVAGVIPDGSQAIAAERCACGQYYISNHPRRRKCFICSPFRRKVIK